MRRETSGTFPHDFTRARPQTGHGPVMKNAMTRMSTAYWRFLDRFIPDAVMDDREAANQARMFLVSHTVGPILGNSVPLAIFAFDPTPTFDTAILALAISSFWVFPVLLRQGFGYRKLVTVSVFVLNFCILWSMFFNGGVASPTVQWILVIPILSLFYIGGETRMRLRLLMVSGASFATFLTCYFALRPEPNDLPAYAMHGLGAVSTIAALCYVATMAIYYSRIFDAGRELEYEVHRRRLVMEEVRQAVITIEKASTAKADFLARMSHELRTPLNAIIGYGQILKEEAVDVDDKLLGKDVDKILDAGQYLLRLINMILDLSKIEAGRMRFSTRAYDLKGLIEACVDQRRLEIEANGTRVVIDVDPGVETVETDRGRFLQIMDAMLENSAKHTVAGTITLRAIRGPSGAGEVPTFRVSVADTGTGIEEDILATLFTTLSHSREASASRYGGTGLKLTVTGALCKALGGRITAASTVGKGSVFTVTLPSRSNSAAGEKDQEVLARPTLPLVASAA